MVQGSSPALAAKCAADDCRVAELPPRHLPTSDSNFQNLVNQVVDLARELTGASGAAIAFRGEQGTICRATSGVGAPALGVRVDSSDGICKRCLDSGTPLWCEDIASDFRVPEVARAGGIRALAVVPIYVGGRVVGVLAVFSGVPRRFSVLQIRWLQQLAVWVRPAKGVAGEGRGFGSEASLLELACSKILGSRGSRSNALPSKGSRSELLRWAVGGSEISRSVLCSEVGRREVGRSNAGTRSQVDDRLWADVFIETQVPWKRFLESVCLHVVVVGLCSALAAFWPQEIETAPRMASGAHITYYPASQAFPAQAFPAYESNREAAEPSRQPAAAERALRPAHRRRKPAETSAASTSAESRTPEPQKMRASVMAAPALPKSSGGRGRKAGVDSAVVPPPGVVEARMRAGRLAKYSVVAPSPELGGGSGLRSSNGPGAAAVAPAPEVGGGGGLRASGAPNLAVVAPSPEIGGDAGLRTGGALKEAVIAPSVDARGLAGGAAGGGRGRAGGGSAGVGDIAIVPPAPSLGVHAMVGFGTRGPGIGNAQVVGAPPTVEAGSGGAGRSGRSGSLGNGAMRVVPPAPSVLGEGNSIGAGRGGSLAAGVSGSRVVGPPPSVQAGGNLGGRGNGGLGGGSAAVAPAPSVGSNLVGGRGVGGLGGGSQVVPPPPSAQAGNNFGGGRGTGGLGGSGSGVVPPTPSVAGIGEGGSGAGGRGGSIEMARSVGIQPSAAGSGNSSAGTGWSGASAGSGNSSAGGGIEAQANSAAESVIDLAHRIYQDVQLRVVSLAWAPPRSSYFSNFEVFIAEKWTSKKESQFIKLVYVFLPYQRRLSEFGRDALRTRRLRVTRDATCDESLMEIMWSDADHSPVGPGPAAPGRVGSRLASPSDRNNALPCYLTTADEYARALVQSQ